MDDRTTIELGFAETGGEEFATIAVRRGVLWRDMPPVLAVDVPNELLVAGIGHHVHETMV